MPVFLDFETRVSKTITLRRVSLAAYLRALGGEQGILGMSIAEDDEDPAFFTPADGVWPDVKARIRELAEAGALFVAHNWSFDGRVLHELMGIPYPRAICSIEAASCAWPNQPGGYSLENLAETLTLPSGRKLGHGADVMRMSSAELEAYCKQDTRLCRDIYRLAMARISANEARILELCGRAKEGEFEVDTAAVGRAVDAFADNADKYANDLAAILGDTDLIAFGADPDNHVRSVKPHVVKRLLLENLGFDTHTISAKKINPVSLAAHEEAKAAVDAAGKANRALSHRRRIGVFRGMERVHAELNAWAAHTGRFASRAVGKGLNLLNMPKHDKEAAPLFRRAFRLPEGLCFVRADEANVEYRVAGLVTGCDTVQRLFTRDVFADPYSNFGMGVTGRPITKADPIRQLFKLAVLGLCLGEGTPVLTSRGWVSIQHVRKEDRVWDGSAWRKHGGVVCTGRKPCIRVNGVWMTRDHRVLTSDGWRPAGAIATRAGTLRPGWEPGSTGSPLRVPNSTGEASAIFHGDATADPREVRGSTSWSGGARSSAADARAPALDGRAVAPGASLESFQTSGCESDGAPHGTTYGSDACPGLTPRTGRDTEDVASECASSTSTRSSGTSLPCPDGMTGPSTSTGSTRTGITDPATCGWSIQQQAQEMLVYDILDVEGTHRFQAGMLIVHNCYGMGLELWVRTLLAAIAKGEVLLADLLQAIEENHWKFPNDRMAKAALTKTGCAPEVVTAAYHTRRAFHDLHPEFFRVARWLVQACEEVSRTGSQAAIDDMYAMPSAPSRQYIDLRVTNRFEGVSLEVWCPASGWDYPAVFWRDIGVREVPVKGVCLSLMTGRKGYRSISPSLLIENVVQAISRQRTSRAKLALTDRNYPYIFNVHDELLPVVFAEPEAILQARHDLIDVLGPHARDPWGWAVVINPAEINVSRSWYEVDVGKLLPPIGTDAKGKPIHPPSDEWWRRLATAGPDFLRNLP